MKKTALIILNYNNCRDTINCLMSLDKHNTAPVKTLVIDNASRAEAREELIQSMKRVYGEDLTILKAEDCVQKRNLNDLVLVLNDVNAGYARGNNVGLAFAYNDDEIDRVMILNNDVLFVEDIIPELIRRQKQTKDCGLISPKLFKPGLEDPDYNCARRNVRVQAMIKENMLHYWWKLTHKKRKVVMGDLYLLDDIDPKAQVAEIELPSGSCMLISKDLMKEIGGFDSYTFLYYEENILYKKLQKIGRKNYLCPDLKCVHLGAATTSNMPASESIMKASLDSQRYYVKEYSGVSPMLKLLHNMSTRWFWLTFKLQKRIQGKR